MKRDLCPQLVQGLQLHRGRDEAAGDVRQDQLTGRTALSATEDELKELRQLRGEDGLDGRLQHRQDVLQGGELAGCVLLLGLVPGVLRNQAVVKDSDNMHSIYKNNTALQIGSAE